MKETDKISKYFTWKEAIWLPSWNRMANQNDGLDEIVINNLNKTFQVMDEIRELFNVPIKVHVAYRPLEYNKQIGGALKSKHMYGMACDFSVKNKTCDEVRAVLKNKIEEWDIRMENNPGSNWVHIDIARVPVGGNRFFNI